MSLTIRQYALLFALITVLIISSFVWHTYNEFDLTSTQIRQSHHQAAESEIQHNLTASLESLIDSAKRLTDWQETHQQLANPSFFAYWYNSRMRHTVNEMQQHISDLMIYDARGEALARLTDNSLPYRLDHLPPPGQPSYTLLDDNTLIFTKAIQVADGEQIKGYLSLRTNLIKLLQQQHNYYYVSPMSLQLASHSMGRQVDTIKAEFIEYQATRPPELERLENQLRESIIKLVLLVLLPGLVVYSMLVYIVSVPINGISAYLEQLRFMPDKNAPYKYNAFFKVRELKSVYESLHDYHNELFDTNIVLDEKNKALWNQAHHDALTGAYNRRAFDDQWSNLKDLLAEHPVNISFMLFDVNLFKSINDTHGHHVGDDVLKNIANCISRGLRKGEHLFRLGGDEFATFLIDTNAETAIEVAERCLKNIEAFQFDKIGMPEPVRVSIGISQATSDDTDSINDLQWQADTAMFTAKRPGSGDIVVYSDELTEGSKGLLSSWLSNTVYQAIDKGEGLVLYYQPVVDFKQRQISYYEALVRIHANDELIPPGSFFPMVEERGFEVELDQAVIKHLAGDLQAGIIPADTGVSLNLSAPTLTRPEIIDWLTPLQPYTRNYKIVLEVTETALITKMSLVTEHLKLLREMNFTIALDDFGSGHSSVKYLGAMRVDVVKFDIELVRSLLDDKQDEIIMRLARLIQEVGHELVAEGIEDKNLLDKVLESGFHFGQGWMFGRPSPVPCDPAEVEKILDENYPSFRQQTFLKPVK